MYSMSNFIAGISINTVLYLFHKFNPKFGSELILENILQNYYPSFLESENFIIEKELGGLGKIWQAALKW